jgi:hypothetical protein
LVSGDSVTGLSQSFDIKNAGSRTLSVNSGYSVSDGNGGANYTVTTATALGSITPATLNVSATGVAKVYDGQTTATVNLGDNRVAGDVLTLGYGAAAYNDKNVGVAKPVSVTGIAIGGSDAGNYTFNTTASASADITRLDSVTWVGGASGLWSLASNWKATAIPGAVPGAIPDLSNVKDVIVPTGNSVTYDAAASAAGATNIASVTAGGLTVAGGTLNIASNLTVSSSFAQTGGALNFGGGASASITQASGNLSLPPIQVAYLSLAAPTGAIVQSGPLAALTLITQSQGTTTLTDPANQVTNRVDMTAGGPLKLWVSGNLNVGSIYAGSSAVEIKAGGAILKAPGTETSTNIIAGSANITSLFGGAPGDLAISTDTQVTGSLAATVGSGASYGGIRIKNTGAQPSSVTLADNALAGAGVSFLNTDSITNTSAYSLSTLNGGDIALLSNGDITWSGGNLATPSGSVLVSADGSVAVTGVLASPVDLALAAVTGINVTGSVVTTGTGTASFTAPSVTLNGTVNAADDVGVVATTLNLGSGSHTRAGHDVILAASNMFSTAAMVDAGHDISAAVTGDMHLNGSGFTAGNDIYLKMLGATSTLYLNDAPGLPQSFLWAQAPSTVHLEFPSRFADGLVVDGAPVNPLKFTAAAGSSGFYYGPAMAPASLGTGLEVVYAYGKGLFDGATALPTIVDAVVAAITPTNPPPSTPRTGDSNTSTGTFDPNSLPATGAGGQSDQTGGTEGTFGGPSGGAKDDKDKNKTDTATGIKKQEDKAIVKKLATCS